MGIQIEFSLPFLSLGAKRNHKITRSPIKRAQLKRFTMQCVHTDTKKITSLGKQFLYAVIHMFQRCTTRRLTDLLSSFGFIMAALRICAIFRRRFQAGHNVRRLHIVSGVYGEATRCEGEISVQADEGVFCFGQDGFEELHHYVPHFGGEHHYQVHLR